MKIKSLLLCNVSFKIGSQRVTLPASPSILELDDKEYKAFLPRLAKLVAEEGAKWIKKPMVSKEEAAKAAAADLAAAKKLVADAEAAAKAAK
tara:strand:+ start:721 stop:996 length:276 start_codon:yes stop_codon:yes gene_type:complete